MATTMPAGWYGDPTQRHEARFWNGDIWTAQVSDGGVTALDSPDALPPWLPPALADTHRPRRGWVIPVSVIGAVLGLISVLLVWAPWKGTGPTTPNGLRSPTTTSTSITVQWNPPTGGSVIDHYLILREGTQVGTAPPTQTSYVDKGLTPGGTYRYRVVAVSGTAQSHASKELAVKTLAPNPVGLKAGIVSVNSATFRWSRPPNAPTPTRYVILSNGKQIAAVPGSTATYQATKLALVTTYKYTVVAVWGENRSAPSSPLVMKTLAPPVSSARFGGKTWTVTSKIVQSAGGNVAVGTKLTDTWQVTPKCKSGPCAVGVNGVLSGDRYAPHPFTMSLSRAGAVYAGTTSVHIEHCGGVPVTDTVNLQITVTKAGAQNNTWVATSWTGTLTDSSPYTYAGGNHYCPAQTNFTASLSASR